MTNEPVLKQSVRWGEHYVSSALNQKLFGILAPGIYHGYEVMPGGGMNVAILHGTDFPVSVAIVERDKYSLTVMMENPGLVPIPGKGDWFVCIEAWYAPNAQGFQRIAARKQPESHHIVLARVSVPEGASEITAEMIDTSMRRQCLSQYDLARIATLEVLGRMKPDGWTIGIKPDGTIFVLPDNLTPNTRKVIAVSGEWIAPVTGWYRVTIINGGFGGNIREDGLAYAGNGSAPKLFIVYLVKDQKVPVTIGAGGRGLTNTNTSSTDKSPLYGGKTSFGDLTHGDIIRGSNNWSFISTGTHVSSSECNGGGIGGGAPGAEDGSHYGAGGGCFWNKDGMNRAGNGYQGAVIVEYHDPAKMPNTSEAGTGQAGEEAREDE